MSSVAFTIVSYSYKPSSMGATTIKYFAQVVSNSDVGQNEPLHIPKVKGDSFCIKITRQDYEKG